MRDGERPSFIDLPRESVIITQGLLVAELALWAAATDDRVEPHEISGVVATVRQLPGLEGFSRDDAMSLLHEMSKLRSEAEVEARVSALTAAIAQPELQRVTYQLAVYCAASDGELTHDEVDFLAFLQWRFGIGDDEAARLFSEVCA
ncbi:MAG: tellurite resistance TerB family protein [Polyangiales bacterium]